MKPFLVNIKQKTVIVLVKLHLISNTWHFRGSSPAILKIGLARKKSRFLWSFVSIWKPNKLCWLSPSTLPKNHHLVFPLQVSMYHLFPLSFCLLFDSIFFFLPLLSIPCSYAHMLESILILLLSIPRTTPTNSRESIQKGYFGDKTIV